MRDCIERTRNWVEEAKPLEGLDPVSRIERVADNHSLIGRMLYLQQEILVRSTSCWLRTDETGQSHTPCSARHVGGARRRVLS